MKQSNTLNHLGEPVDILVYANDAENDYFQPTPFTTWEIDVPRDYNRGLNLENVSGVGLQFIGTCIAVSGDINSLTTAAGGTKSAVDAQFTYL